MGNNIDTYLIQRIEQDKIVRNVLLERYSLICQKYREDFPDNAKLNDVYWAQFEA